MYSGPPSGPLQLVRADAGPDGDALDPDPRRASTAIACCSSRSDRRPRAATTQDDERTRPAGADPRRRRLGARSHGRPSDGCRWRSPGPTRRSARQPAALRARRPRHRRPRWPRSPGELSRAARSSTSPPTAGSPPARRAGSRPRAPAEPQRNLANSGRLGRPGLRGREHRAFDDDAATLTLIRRRRPAPDSGPRSLDPTPTSTATTAGVAWLFNGCVRYAPFAPARRARGARTRARPARSRSTRSARSRSCATAPARHAGHVASPSASGRCRGTLVARHRLRHADRRPRHVRLPVGDRGSKVPSPFRPLHAIAKFRREDGGLGRGRREACRDGTVGSGADYSSEFGIEVD